MSEAVVTIERNATFYILAVTAVFSVLYALGIMLVGLGASLQNSMLHSAGNTLLVFRIWQIAGVPLLVFFLVKRLPYQFMLIPLLLTALLAWVPLESSLRFPLGAFSLLRDTLTVTLGLATAAYALILTQDTHTSMRY